MSLVLKSVLETLRRVPLFNDLSDDELEAVAARASIHRYDAGQTVFSEGDRGGDLLIVQEGELKTLKMAASGRHQLITIERPGSSLGEVSVFDGGCYSTTAITVTSAVLLRIQGEQLNRLCMANPAVAIKVIRVLGHRLRHLRRLVEDLSFATVRNRLISHLLRLAEESRSERGSPVRFGLVENNEELAARLGTVRELISRNLGRLHGEGLIIMSRRAVAIPDEDRLRAQLEP